MPQLNPRRRSINYNEIHDRPGSLVPYKSAAKIRNRIVALLFVLCSGALWVGCTGKTTTPDIVAAPPRELHAPLSEECIDGLTQDEKMDRDSITLLTVRRSQLTTIGCPGGTDFKSICLKKEYTWMIVFYIMGIFYMFAGLAIVCDEFFVPALECFVDNMGISMDVAGATFMAAGGSMPELFTSFIATFNESNVGFAAIVGSAVFNVLFVIAVCAIASEQVLELSGWPLARDCMFYLIALFTVVGVFVNTDPAEITWWEACILLWLYALYCTFMKFNETIKAFCFKKWDRFRGKVEPSPGNSPSNSQIMDDEKRTFGHPSSFRKGIIKILTENSCVYETAGIAAVTAIGANLEKTFEELDKDDDGFLDVDEVMKLLSKVGVTQHAEVVKTAVRRISRNGDGKLSFEAFRKWYQASEARIEIEVRRVFDKFDKDGNGTIELTEIKELLRSLGHEPGEDEVQDTIKQLLAFDADEEEEGEEGEEKKKDDEDQESNPETNKPGSVSNSDSKQRRNSDGVHVTFGQFNAWYSKSMFWDGHHEKHQKEADDEAVPLSLEPPENASWSAFFWYLFTYPLCAMMYCTLPDVRKGDQKRNTKICVAEFCLSLVWIGIFSNCLYEWIVVVSDTVGIPAEVSAVTVLAAGTSVPDLLSSYIVARQGQGDMAVSSSIGSNIFDVTVGLPLPWLSYNIIKNQTVKVGADNLKFSIVVLMLMLISVICTVMLMKWKMTKMLGYIMLVLYFVFVAQDLLQQLPKGNPVLKTNM